MGMAASQARLLSITARMSDNEQSGQQLSYAKERLADRTDQVTKEYNEALKATKLQIMTGYSDGAASNTDISKKSQKAMIKDCYFRKEIVVLIELSSVIWGLLFVKCAGCDLMSHVFCCFCSGNDVLLHREISRK